MRSQINAALKTISPRIALQSSFEIKWRNERESEVTREGAWYTAKNEELANGREENFIGCPLSIRGHAVYTDRFA